MLPILTRKVKSVLASTKDDARELSGFIQRVLDFDDRVRADFNYTEGEAEFGWKGLSWDVINQSHEAWLQGEKTFAFSRKYLSTFRFV